MDAASVASVVALDVQPGANVLDLCCCPGMKLKLISELAKAGPSSGLALGVDVSLSRLYVARALAARLGGTNTILALGDGTNFDPKLLEQDINIRRTPAKQQQYLRNKEGLAQDEATAAPTVMWCSDDIRQTILKTAPKRGRGEDAGPLTATPVPLPSEFDCVLVDAECTHDGSLHHIVSSSSVTPSEGSPSFQDSLYKYKPNYSLHTEEGGAGLHTLQLNLLRRGFELVKPNGHVVYSTCSFSEGQNEAIVKKFLEISNGSSSSSSSSPTAVLVDPFDHLLSGQGEVHAELKAVAEDGLGGVGIRLNPTKTHSSFQYVAKLKKVIR
eukprot:GILI01026763.1.p1 GENE.GILI01026763.1~~GILI01026763.1.p1  ORF type:complete len:373 (+),score=46.57 GILI01026763.1:140-1120(+)